MNFEEKLIERLKRVEREVERLRVWERPAGGSGGGATDHGALTGLADNDHPQYLLTTAQAADSDTVDGKHAADFLGVNAKAADSDKLDGLDSTAFATAGHDHDTDYLGISAKAADSDKLDGLDSTAFAKVITLTAGDGLTGGGDLSADRTFDVNPGAGIAILDDKVIVDQTENFNWTGEHTFTKYLSTASIYPNVSDTYDLGDYNRLWRKIWGSELSAIVFAQYTQVLLGGWFTVSKGEGIVKAAVTAAATTIDLGSNNFATNDIIVFRGIGVAGQQVEYMKVGRLVSGTTYNVTRNLDGTGANAWPEGSVYGNWGQTGNGRVELNAYDTPRMSVYSQGAAYNDAKEQIRIGDLNGQWGYSAATYGAAFGSYETGKANITIDPTNGIRIRNYNQTVIQLNGTEASFENVIKLGTSGRLQQGTGVWGTNFTGSAIWNESGVMNIGGWKNNVKQWWGGSDDGRFCAGGGDVIIDDIGISIVNPSPGIGDQPFRFIDSNNNQYFSISGASVLGRTEGIMILENPPEEPLNSYTEFSIIAKNTVNVTSFSRLDLQAFDDGGKIIKTNANFSAPNIIVSQNLVVDGTIKDGGGVAYLKSNAKAADSDKLDGLDSTDFGRPVFLTTPLTSTSWDGDNKDTGDRATVDLSTVFGVPAGVKAVLMSIQTQANAVNDYIRFGPNSTYNYVLTCRTSVANQIAHAIGIVPCDSNGDIYCYPSGTIEEVYVWIWGYWL